MIQYEHIILEDEHWLKDISSLPKSLWVGYNYPEIFSITIVTVAMGKLGFLFNAVSTIIISMQKYGIVEQYENSSKNRVFRIC